MTVSPSPMALTPASRSAYPAWPRSRPSLSKRGLQPLRKLLRALLLLAPSLALPGCAVTPEAQGETQWISLFDRTSLSGWEGNEAYFRVQDWAIVGGTDEAPIPRNEFLCRGEEVDDFELRLQFRLDEGVNSGVQVRSQRIPDSHETIGYQADLGAGYWGAIYDESRRNTVVAQPDSAAVAEALTPLGWNDYRIVAQGPRIQLFINGRQTVDYTELDPSIEQGGRICLQIHSGPPGEVRFREIRMRELN